MGHYQIYYKPQLPIYMATIWTEQSKTMPKYQSLNQRQKEEAPLNRRRRQGHKYSKNLFPKFLRTAPRFISVFEVFIQFIHYIHVNTHFIKTSHASIRLAVTQFDFKIRYKIPHHFN